MKNELRRELRTRAELIRGLVNVLTEDAKYICVDAKDFDLVGLGESVREIKDTVDSLRDNVKELEYTLYMVKRGGS